MRKKSRHDTLRDGLKEEGEGGTVAMVTNVEEAQ